MHDVYSYIMNISVLVDYGHGRIFRRFLFFSLGIQQFSIISKTSIESLKYYSDCNGEGYMVFVANRGFVIYT